uniref:Uncharacterized protein n=1 Tax=Podoviridae sp. ctlpi2 TaxID=2826574 RepID=A0A8S5MLN8_9CAUD|nr:MAG TPA: hypothetical protein [Podoviridae sp. ctlpi2]
MRIFPANAEIATFVDLKNAATNCGYLTQYPDGFWSALFAYIKDNGPSDQTPYVLDIAALMDTVDSLEAADLIHGAWNQPIRDAVHNLAMADDTYAVLESCPPDDAPAQWWLDRLAGEDMPALAELMTNVLTDGGKIVIYTARDAGTVYFIK